MAPNSESGFSASQLSPLELRFGPVEGSGSVPNATTGNKLGTNGYAAGAVHTTVDAKNSLLQPLQPTATTGGTGRVSNAGTGALDGNRPGIGLHHGKQLPQIGK